MPNFLTLYVPMLNNAVIQIPAPVNEPVRTYAPGSPERTALKAELQAQRSREVEVPCIIGGKEFRSGKTVEIRAPHDHAHVLGHYHEATSEMVEEAIRVAVEARREWSFMDFTDRAAIFLRAAEILAGPRRYQMNAATMLGQSKNAYQAEIDSACELIDFLRFNVSYAQAIYQQQPGSVAGEWNTMTYRPLEGFVFAVTPFNFTAIGGNLPTAPAIMGNTVLLKPASTAVLSAYYFYKILEEAGLPAGVINFLPGRGATIGNPVFASRHFAGLHFTGSTETFRSMWQTIAGNLPAYKSYPRIVGETGGKDFVVAHASADPKQVATGLVRGAFEYQGQKCSAASRAYIPESLWPAVWQEMQEQLHSIKMGPVEDFSNFMNAVIDQGAFDSITGYIGDAKKQSGLEVLHGGNYDASEGYFIEPTVLKVTDPSYRTMCEEIFGPVLTAYCYPETKWQETLALVNETSPYALTGSVFARERQAIVEAERALIDAAGNFYINDKPTGAVVGRQPFGGARASGTNDKAGSYLNLIRWVSARAVKETYNPPSHYGYPFHQEA